MPLQTLTAWQDRWLAGAAAWLAGPRWRWYVVGLCVLSALFFQLPNYRHLYQQLALHRGLEPNLEVLRQQIAEPFTSHNDVARTHMAKMAYRLALPLLARLLHLSVGGLLLGQFALGVSMYYCLLGLLERLLRDRLAATLLALGLSCTYFGSAFAFDLYGYFDAVCYALLVFLFSTRQGWLIFGLCLLGSFVDERMLLASLLAVYWYGGQRYGWEWPGNWHFLGTRPAWAVYAAWVAWAGLRLWLMRTYHLPLYLELAGLPSVRESLRLDLTGLGFLSGLKSFWLLPVLAAGLLWPQRRQHLAGLLACSAPVFLGAFLVMDTTRSLSYGLPVIFSCLSLLALHTDVAERRRLAASLAFFAWLIPSYNVLGHIQYASPAYLTLLKLWATRH